ncbi:hypothetical protein CTM92_11020 [Fusobacterium pseudoperiodonticum]|nr:hypothetical protein CTM92_11020 [Fusobacterium pseudoperiodonticum]
MSEASFPVLQRILNFYSLRNLASNELFYVILLYCLQLLKHQLSYHIQLFQYLLQLFVFQRL